ncbi:MAG: BTAD domain-containing putative transcriptional regulator [Microbacterium sp.]
MSAAEAQTVDGSLRVVPQSQAVCLLDGPFVIDDERRIHVPEGSEKLLVFVALRNGRAVSRRTVAGTLWPAVNEDRAAGNLRTALWRLRSSGIRLLEADRHTLAVTRGTSVDVFALDEWASRLIDGTASREDFSLHHFNPAAMELLSGWYDDWVIFERERLRQRLLHALEVLSQRLAEECLFGEAVEAAMTAIQIDPLRESAQRSLILVHLSEGNVAEALRTYAAYVRLLDSELGIAPTPELTRLVHVPRAAGAEVASVTGGGSRGG